MLKKNKIQPIEAIELTKVVRVAPAPSMPAVSYRNESPKRHNLDILREVLKVKQGCSQM